MVCVMCMWNDMVGVEVFDLRRDLCGELKVLGGDGELLILFYI